MAAIKLLEGEVIDWAKLGAFVCENLPSYARPYFIRVRDTIDATNSFKQVKTQLQREGFDPNVIKDPLYFLHPEKNVYVELTPELYEKIVSHEIKFSNSRNALPDQGRALSILLWPAPIMGLVALATAVGLF